MCVYIYLYVSVLKRACDTRKYIRTHKQLDVLRFLSEFAGESGVAMSGQDLLAWR